MLPTALAPTCCMTLSWSDTGDCNGTVLCDGWPNPGDPGWKLVKDEHGCDSWVNPNDRQCGPDCSYACCGCPFSRDMTLPSSEGGIDAGDGGSDASDGGAGRG
jgi:hypothetical protein